MSSFAELVKEYDGMTWDYPVECSDNITDEQRKRIIKLGYYGKQIKLEHAKMLEDNICYKNDNPYSINYRGCDGQETFEFETLEKAKKFIIPRIEWTNSDTCVGAEMAIYYLEGFKLSDIGINWKERTP